MKPTDIAAAAAVRMTLRHPFWTEVFYSMTIHEAKPEDGIPTQATDGRNLWINPTFFKSIPLEQQVAELVHELFHKILLHPTRRGNRDPYVFNVACDYVINAGMKTMGFNIPKDWLLDMQYDGWLAEAVYNDLMKKAKQKQQGQGQQGQPGQGPAGKAHPGSAPCPPGIPQLAPGRQDLRDNPAVQHPEELQKFEEEVKAMVERAVAMAKAMGNLPVGMEKASEAWAPKREPWYNHLHRFMQSLASSEYNWQRLNRRTLRSHGIFTPMHLSEALGDVAVFIDTSGSCYASAQQANFAGHLNAILAEARPRRVHLYYFDTKVYPGREIEAGELDVATKPRGGGGTSFVDIFDELERADIAPEVCIILTDLCGHFPSHGPEYPVVWASTLDDMTAPFGETIYVVD